MSTGAALELLVRFAELLSPEKGSEPRARAFAAANCLSELTTIAPGTQRKCPFGVAMRK